jgi:hypothetical protein
LLERFLLPRQGRAQPILPTRDRAQHFLRGRDARRRRGLRGCAAFGGGPTRTLSPAGRPCLARLLLARAWSLRRGTSGGPCCAAAGLGGGFVSHVGAFSSFESSAVICPSTALFRRCTPGGPDQSTMREETASSMFLRMTHQPKQPLPRAVQARRRWPYACRRRADRSASRQDCSSTAPGFVGARWGRTQVIGLRRPCRLPRRRR